ETGPLIANTASSKLSPGDTSVAKTSLNLDRCRNGLAERRRRYLFEHGAKFERGLPPERAFELTLGGGPARTALGYGGLPGLCQRHHAAAPIPFGNFELDQTGFFERAQ